jgi:branched-chain amino acid transport system permease protein
MEFNLGFLLISVVKIAAVLAWIYGMLRVLGSPSRYVKAVGVILAFAVIQLALAVPVGDSPLLNDFDQGLLLQASAMAMVLGLNLIYGFNGQFSLGQWGFYGIGAYAAADVTYRWTNGDARGLLVLSLGVILGGLTIWRVNRMLQHYKGMPVLSAFTLYFLGSIVAAPSSSWGARSAACYPTVWDQRRPGSAEQRPGVAGGVLPRRPAGGRLCCRRSASSSGCPC